MARLRIVQVGAGAWGGSWVPVVQQSVDWELAALVDLDRETLTRVGERTGVPAERRFGSLEDALAAREADAALIAVPPVAHASVASEALAAGLHCLVEKPLTPTLSEGQALVEAAQAAERRLMVSQHFRFTPGARTVRDLVAAGSIGRVEAAYVRFFRAPLFKGFRLEMEEPLLVDMAVHHFDLVRGVLGFEPERVYMRSFNPSWSPFKGNAAASGHLERIDGPLVCYDGSWVARGPETAWEGNWSIHGDAGWIGWNETQVLLAPPGVRLERTLRRRIRRRPVPAVVPLPPVEAEGRIGVLRELAQAIMNGREPEANGLDNLASLALVHAAIESTRTGEIVDVAP
ncbi:MAG: Gfo/Idh/MocA family oxidoreductase [Gaiellales bacterium]